MLTKSDAGELRLSELELNILQMLANDATNAGICTALDISDHVLNTSIDHLKGLLTTTTLTGAIAKAVRSGLID